MVDILGLNLRYRTADITSPDGIDRIRRYAVGWCPAERLPCRPKIEHTAVMFFKDGRYFWFHLRNNEALATALKA